MNLIYHTSLDCSIERCIYYVYLGTARAYLLKSAFFNSVKFWRTKSRIFLSVNFLLNSISFTLPSRFSWSQGFPHGITLGHSLNHTKVWDNFTPVTALAGEGDRVLSLAELDSTIVRKQTEVGTLKFYTGWLHAMQLNHHADTGLGFWQSLLQRTNNNYNYNTRNIEILDKTTNKMEINPCTHKWHETRNI